MVKVPESAEKPGVQQSDKQASKINSLHMPSPPTPSLTLTPNTHAFISNQSEQPESQAAEGPALLADAGCPEDLDTLRYAST